DKAVLSDRDLRLSEDFLDVEFAVNRERRSALSGKVALLERLVGVQGQRFLAVFETDVDADPIFRPGQPHPVIAKRTGEVDVGKLLRGPAFDHVKDVEVVYCLSRRSSEDIVGDAVRIALVEDRAADDLRTRSSDRNDITIFVNVDHVEG